ncbi:hypothetical protein FS837_006526 [Tulasnella sp. UAMH 9824]|nr:hypothetical protein FS837_006526 [Tulasnella sp. UAMH 9824]
MEEAGQEAGAGAGLGVIIDATGATPREVSSITQVSSSPWGVTNDPTRLPELRHNLRLIVDMAKNELDGLAREAKALQERKKWVHDEDARLRKAVVDEAELIQRLQKVHIIVDDINSKAKEAAGLYEPTLQPFAPSVTSLIHDYSPEYEKYKLDDIVVAAIAPVVRRLLTQWQPLEDPTFLTGELRAWKPALRTSAVPREDSQVVLYGGFKADVAKKKEELVMTPYESLLWNVWLPKIRSCINNEWNPVDSQPLIQLLEAWSDLLPQFIRDNVMDQLVLPKVQKAIAEWNPKRNEGTLHGLVFPWLPHVGLRLEALVGDARRKVKNLFRSWTADQGLPEHLMVWQKVFEKKEWEDALLKYVVPKLGATLRDDFKIDPRNQVMEPFQWVMVWVPHLRASIFAQLLETEFFPKWLSIMHRWLANPNANLDEVTRWYTSWKEQFPESLTSDPRIGHGFTTGLQLMHSAMNLDSGARHTLQKPDFKPLGLPSKAQHGKSRRPDQPQPTAAGGEITFKSIVEECVAEHNLLFLPAGKTHERSRMPLYKVSPNVDGKGGLMVYLLDDAVWGPPADGDGAEYRAISLEDMVLRATKSKK